MLLLSLPTSLLLVLEAYAQTSEITLSGSHTVKSILNLGGDLVPTGSSVTYYTDNSTSTIPTGSHSGSLLLLASTFASANGSAVSTIAPSSTSQSLTILQGSAGSSSTAALNGTVNGNSTAGSTSPTSPAPTNTQPCNNYPEFCSRKYSNITYVAAHNSPFVAPNNVAANQEYGVISQLSDGIRMIQGQTHMVNNTIFYCHTSCDLLNVGTAESYFANITGWIQSHPYDVVSILIGNGDLVDVGNYTQPLEASGLSKWAYTPPKIPMGIDDWPTLSEMILTQKRAVIFMDYQANQTKVPFILDEFSQIWETPFSPTNDTFPCTQQRPPGLSHLDAEKRMYMANHNLNTEVSFAGTSLLVPTTPLLNQTNAINGTGSLGLMANNCAGKFSLSFDQKHSPLSLLSPRKSKLSNFCPDPSKTEAWHRPPNFLLVDYYNYGSSHGSVFQVAAQHNNVTYSRPCCGQIVTSAAANASQPSMSSLLLIYVGVLAGASFVAF